jgi:hypothetical protein|tara:strand:+ start:652 stop:957 length:306 start_codon:yes stop_codon:yes gene_type:complete
MPNDDKIHIDRNDHKLIIEKKQDVAPVLEQNKLFRNHIPEAQKGDLQRIAQIPLIALQIKTKELFGHSNWHRLDKDTQKTIIRRMVNSSEYAHFRTGNKGL